MRLAMERMPDNPRKGALLYGPVVLAGVLGTEGMQPPAPYSNPFRYNDYYTYDYHIPQGLPCSLPWDDRHPERVLKRTGKGLAFVTESGVQVFPLYDVHRQRYVVYWDCMEQQ